MGGENESVIQKRSKKTDAAVGVQTITSDTQTIRVHRSGSEIHFHDDEKKLKAAVPNSVFWHAWAALSHVSGPSFSYLDPVNLTKLRIFPAYEGKDLKVVVEKVTEVGSTYRALQRLVE